MVSRRILGRTLDERRSKSRKSTHDFSLTCYIVKVSLDWIPIDRLTASDIQKTPGGLVAVICLVILVVLCVVNQLRIIRRTGWFFFYLKWYAVGGAVIGVLAALPGLEIRLHHYIAA